MTMMTKRLALLSLLLLPLIACTGQKPEQAAGTAATGAAADAAMPPPAAEAAPVAGDSAAAAETQPAADSPPAAAPPATTPEGPPAVAGRDYIEIPNGQPFLPLDGKIEVVEVFNYVCPACAAIQPLIGAWKAKLPADVRFTYVPAPFGERWDPYVRAYYAAEAMGVADKAHDTMFHAIHIEHALKGELGNDSPEQIAAVYARFGVDARQFASTMASFAIDGKLNRNRQFIVRSKINGTPSVLVNGKYLVKGRDYQDMLRIADQLIAQERAARR